ncbi:MAG: PAS domain-containing protein [Alphaproteobacteria bacterium]
MFVLPPEAFEPELIELYEYWLRKAPPGRLPGRQHIDPIDLSARLLPHVLLLDVVRGPEGLRFRLRLAGTAVAQLIGREIAGLYFDEIAPPERTAPVIAGLCAIVESRKPVFLESPLTVPSRDYIWVKRLGLPLARDGETIDMVLAAFHAVLNPRDRRLPAARPALPVR